ncbi:MAG: aldo/keto reductase [Planctomycetales bacterium]|nr:aldo/keto reductase [Planctomycetales bacterium]
MTLPSPTPAPSSRRNLGPDGPLVSPVALGCWPIAGVTTLGANEADSLATIQAALDAGINYFDTAYCYGANGESDSLLGQVLPAVRDDVVIAAKGGIHYNDAGQQAQDARPETLAAECEQSLSRLRTERVELFYLHSPDPNVPVSESAGAIARLIEQGKVLSAGASNCTLAQIEEFHAACPLAAVQLPYNMLQRDIEQQTLPWCRERGIAVCVYWPLMKGLLAGGIADAAKLDSADNRRQYPMYQGEEWVKNRKFVDRLQEIAAEAGRTVAQLVVHWTFSQPGITAALCGAKRPWQIEETAGAMGWMLTAEQAAAIEDAIAARGHAAAKRVFT